MNLKEVLEKEKKNFNKIYLYIDTENNLCYAYEFSAYMLTRLLDSLELKEKTESGTIVFSTQLPIQSVVKCFSGPNTSVGDDFVRIDVDEPQNCIQWKSEFKELKTNQHKSHNKLLNCIFVFLGWTM